MPHSYKLLIKISYERKSLDLLRYMDTEKTMKSMYREIPHVLLVRKSVDQFLLKMQQFKLPVEYPLGLFHCQPMEEIKRN